MFGTVLVANRGEIALRVMRTCARLGIRTVAVFTDIDATAPHVLAADDAIRVPSYLDIDEVVAAAVDAGAAAIHPGYGFLSENADFARAVEAAGMTFVGPPAAAIEAMGRKDAAREIAIAAGVPVVPRGEDAGFPVLVKAAAGGGGKGMRIVQSAADLEPAMAAARRESLAAFGDDTMLVEKYVEHGRHVEVQVIADAHGTVLHLFERDCSAQRRHQKVLEEAPAPTITDDQRALVTSSAVALAREVGYTNAGTVEFLLDADTGKAYFLEMNTRLQVEHPVTEAVVRVGGQRVDLVELQLRVAAGEPLGFTQGDVTLDGHAIEARVYAEDAFGGFLPQAGGATLVRWPEGVRVDHALESGQVVSTAYDPMLGKVVAEGTDRDAARRELVDALDRTAVLGLTTNVGFLRALAASNAFRETDVDTAWLDRNQLPAPDAHLARLFAAWTQALLAAEYAGPPHPWQADGWRLGADPAPQLVQLDHPVTVDRARGVVVLDGREHRVRQLLAERHVVVLSVDGRRQRAVVNVEAHVVEVVIWGQRFVFERPDVMADHGTVAGDGTVVSPMPGTVLDVRVAPGDAVTAGQVLGLVEAMKMELSLTAPFDGTVVEVDVAPGQPVALGARMFVVEPMQEEERS